MLSFLPTSTSNKMSVSLTLEEYNKLFTNSWLVERKIAELEAHIADLERHNAYLDEERNHAHENIVKLAMVCKEYHRRERDKTAK